LDVHAFHHPSNKVGDTLGTGSQPIMFFNGKVDQAAAPRLKNSSPKTFSICLNSCWTENHAEVAILPVGVWSKHGVSV